MYKYYYKTPNNFDDLILTSDGKYLTNLLFLQDSNLQKYREFVEKELPIFSKTIEYLNIYFSGEKPNFIPEYKLENITSFQKEVLALTSLIHYGSLSTYKDIAAKIAIARNISKMSCQAVGQAIGANPICIIIPCHRVIGASGNLTGYSGGLSNKINLLSLEKHDINQYALPKMKHYPH